jgi:hypothetical protein
MRKALRLTLLTCIVLTPWALDRTPAHAQPPFACDRLQGRSCSPDGTVSPTCILDSGVLGNCVCLSGQWSC